MSRALICALFVSTNRISAQLTYAIKTGFSIKLKTHISQAPTHYKILEVKQCRQLSYKTLITI